MVPLKVLSVLFRSTSAPPVVTYTRLCRDRLTSIGQLSGALVMTKVYVCGTHPELTTTHMVFWPTAKGKAAFKAVTVPAGVLVAGFKVGASIKAEPRVAVYTTDAAPKPTTLICDTVFGTVEVNWRLLVVNFSLKNNLVPPVAPVRISMELNTSLFGGQLSQARFTVKVYFWFGQLFPANM